MKSLLALLLAFGIIGFYFYLIYLLAKVVWPLLPNWGQGIGFVGLAALLIGAPIICFAPIARKRYSHGIKKDNEIKKDKDDE
mgnify:CR=1 FL=1